MDEYQNQEFTTVSLTPGVVSQEKQPALLAPKAPENVYVNAKELRFVSAEGDTTTFELDLLVTVDSKSTVITRKLVMNNTSLGLEALNTLDGRKTIYVEAQNEQNTSLKQLRWMAGISYD